MAIGKVYDSSETARLNAFIDAKSANLASSQNTDEAKKKRMLGYAVVLVGAILTLVSIKLLTRKK